jgi:hypothetical protein
MLRGPTSRSSRVRFSANCRRSQACLLALSVLASMLHKAQTCLRHSSCSISAAARLCLHCAPETLVRHKGRGKVLFHGALSHHTKHEEVLHCEGLANLAGDGVYERPART